MSIDPNSDEWRFAMNEKLQLESIRSTLMFSSLLQMAHEMIKRDVLHKVRSFYGFSEFDGVGWGGNSKARDRYAQEVLSLDGNSSFNASLLWIESLDGISPVDSRRIAEIYLHRHSLAHDIAVFIVDVETNPDVEVLVDAVRIMRKLSRFWIKFEIDLGTFEEFENVDVNAVQDGQTMVLELCLSAYLEVVDHGSKFNKNEAK